MLALRVLLVSETETRLKSVVFRKAKANQRLLSELRQSVTKHPTGARVTRLKLKGEIYECEKTAENAVFLRIFAAFGENKGIVA